MSGLSLQGDRGALAEARAPRPAHRRHGLAAGQEVWIVFGGRADQFWLRLLRPGFRHCFAALRDEVGWTVVDPLSGRLLITRLGVTSEFDMPAFWQRSGLTVVGPLRPAAPTPRLPRPGLLSCVSLCRPS